jgi:dihydroneopterin aldolase/2-amino-4-hydroxy-6-hydroxymethyldihydropteridine diphosphokinase
MIPVFVALGSNVEPRLKYLTSAVDEMQLAGKIGKIAPLYSSSGYGVEDQADFLNSACILGTNLLPLDLLKTLKDIELKLGRKKRSRWGPREIDLDIIFYNNEVIEEEGLIIPHPDYKNRRFVLGPISEMEPDFNPPRENKNVKQLLDSCRDDTHIKLEMTNWYHNGSNI